jgi:hypothetical protein
MISGLKGSRGAAGGVFIALAAIAWLALPLGHPVYALVIPPLIAGGVVIAAIRLRRGPRHPSIRDHRSTPVSPGAPIEQND